MLCLLIPSGLKAISPIAHSKFELNFYQYMKSRFNAKRRESPSVAGYQIASAILKIS